ncbi:MAG: AIR synthase related protein [Desulfurococcales archaeon]|nr:AIR synthase related protein [Desulfurococcales archaeon]
MPEKNGKLPIGKLPLNTLSNLVLRRIRGAVSPDTIIGPGIGEDTAIIRLPCCDLLIHSDPITEAVAGAGKLSIIVASNDIAASGACPTHAVLTLLLPEGYEIESLKQLIQEIQETSRMLDIDIVGGHTETTPGITKPTLIVTMIGITCPGCSIPTSNLRENHYIIQIGEAAREGASIIITDFPALVKECELGEDEISNLNIDARDLSIVKPACLLAENQLVSSMHDATEGGIIGALVEMAKAAKTNITVYKNKILVNPAVRKLSSCLGLDSLKLISSGTLLAGIPPDKVNEAIEVLEKHGFQVSIIGKAMSKCSNPEECGVDLVLEDDTVKRFVEPPIDEISRVWSRHVERRGGAG